MLNLRKPSRVVITAAIILVVILSMLIAINRVNGHKPLVAGTYTTDDGLMQVVFHDNNEFYITTHEVCYSPTGSWVYETEPYNNRVILMSSVFERYIFSYNANSITFESGEWLENWILPGAKFALSTQEICK